MSNTLERSGYLVVKLLGDVLVKLGLAEPIPPKPEPTPIPTTPPAPPPEPKGYYLKCVRKNTRDDRGNEVLGLSICPLGSDNPISTLHTVSGQPGAQAFRIGRESKSGSMEPLPQGEYVIGEVEWASGTPGDYSKNWNDGLGPVWIAITPKFLTERSALGMHLDANRASAPGSAGCLTVTSLADLKTLVAWFDKYKPTLLVCDWGIGAPAKKLTPSEKCVSLIKKWEGCYLTSYVCPAGQWTVGWGSVYHYDLKRPVQEGDVIEQWKADEYLAREVAEKAKGVLEALGSTSCNQNQFDAFVSFAYNCGVQAFADSTLLRKFKAGDIQGAANEFDRWIHGNPGEVLPGLVSRRKDEKELFLS